MSTPSQEAILIVSAGMMQIPAIKTAKALGLRVVATDRNANAPGFALCDEAVVLDSKDVDGHVRFALEHRERLNLRAAFAGSDIAVTVAAVTNALGLPGIPLDVAQRSNNKGLMKERWLRDGIPTPFGAEVQTLEEARQVLKRTGFPAIVKAVDNAASRGSMKIESEAELPQALEQARAASRTGTAIVEQYVVGAEQSVETIVWQGRHYHVGMADREFGYHPFHIETAHNDPSLLGDDTQRRIYEVVDAAADSLGITFGPAKADMIMTASGPMILEMPARLSGGFHSQYTTPLSTGQDPIRAVMEISLGRPLDEALIRPRQHRTAICAGIFPPPGRIKAIEGLEAARALPGIEQVIVTRQVGDVVTEYIDNGCRFCWVIGVGDDKAQAQAAIARARATIRIEVEPAA
ncbi:ATP-grasp domain-containing protein [Roseateles asaccharophilus]|uniref:Biotin carboxylase n=1 Tax=Roseateles asaccharophilus TaxID=582607 RepID=A0ABU2A9U8_9BURK|nr:ATP-grasp domain-containing protein [Roseateles asaccharophilus]MDR7333939.1 biotin carboxylase [Roseateles asaccharophilus]